MVQNEKKKMYRDLLFLIIIVRRIKRRKEKRKRKRMRLIIVSALITIFCIQPYNANRAKKETISNERSNKEIGKKKRNN